MDDIYLDPYGEDSDLDLDDSGVEDNIESAEKSSDAGPMKLKGGGFYAQDIEVDKETYEDNVKTFDLIRQLFQDINNIPKEFIESEAIIATLIQIVGVDQFEQNMQIAYHRQQLRVWETSVDLLQSLSDTMDMDIENGKNTAQQAAVIHTAIESAKELAARVQTFHIDALAQYQVDEEYYYNSKLSFVIPHLNIGNFVARITKKISYARQNPKPKQRSARPDRYSFNG